MADYKNQHIVPRRYLEIFSDENNKVWFYDGKNLRHVPHKSQNQDDYFYSKELASEVEKILEKGEQLFFGKLDNAENITKNETETALFLQLVLDMNFRNSKHENKTHLERHDAIKGILSSYILQSVLGLKENGQSLNEIHYNLSCLWRMCLLKIPENPSELFITSDCPSVIANDGNGNPPCFIFIPISPKRALFFADKRKYIFNKLSVEVNQSEIEKLNAVTCINANNQIYSLKEPTKLQLQRYQIGLTNDLYKGRGAVFHNDKGELQFKAAELSFNEEAINAFSFLQKDSKKFEIISYKEAQKVYNSGALKIDWRQKRIVVQGNLNVTQLYCATRAKEIDDRMQGFEKWKESLSKK
jgi:hypothetical protein